jgi:anti-sigma B factor antagonist
MQHFPLSGWHHPGTLDIEVSGDGDCYNVLLRGDLDLCTAHELRSALEGCATTGTRLVVIDLAGLGFLAAAGLHVFIDAQKVLDKCGARLVLTRVPPYAMRILRLADLQDLLAVELHTDQRATRARIDLRDRGVPVREAN